MEKVVTYQAAAGEKINVCVQCEKALTRDRSWPKNRRGEEYCTVSQGLHFGTCDICR